MYDDGDHEWLKLEKEKWEVLDGGRAARQRNRARQEAAAPAPAAAAVAPKAAAVAPEAGGAKLFGAGAAGMQADGGSPEAADEPADKGGPSSEDDDSDEDEDVTEKEKEVGNDDGDGKMDSTTLLAQLQTSLAQEYGYTGSLDGWSASSKTWFVGRKRTGVRSIIIFEHAAHGTFKAEAASLHKGVAAVAAALGLQKVPAGAARSTPAKQQHASQQPVTGDMSNPPPSSKAQPPAATARAALGQVPTAMHQVPSDGQGDKSAEGGTSSSELLATLQSALVQEYSYEGDLDGWSASIRTWRVGRGGSGQRSMVTFEHEVHGAIKAETNGMHKGAAGVAAALGLKKLQASKLRGISGHGNDEAAGAGMLLALAGQPLPAAVAAVGPAGRKRGSGPATEEQASKQACRSKDVGADHAAAALTSVAAVASSQQAGDREEEDEEEGSPEPERKRRRTARQRPAPVTAPAPAAVQQGAAAGCMEAAAAAAQVVLASSPQPPPNTLSKQPGASPAPSPLDLNGPGQDTSPDVKGSGAQGDQTKPQGGSKDTPDFMAQLRQALASEYGWQGTPSLDGWTARGLYSSAGRGNGKMRWYVTWKHPDHAPCKHAGAVARALGLGGKKQ